MKYLLSRREPAGRRILFIESGARSLAELMPAHFAAWNTGMPVDLVTCYGGLPGGFPSHTEVFRVTDYNTPEARKGLIALLRGREYAYAGIICSGEPIMTRWKWALALQIPAKVFVLNENGDYFWLNRENLSIIREFALVRAGLHGAGAIRTIGRLLLFPFAIFFLLLYALSAHTLRAFRLAFRKINQT